MAEEQQHGQIKVILLSAEDMGRAGLAAAQEVFLESGGTRGRDAVIAWGGAEWLQQWDAAQKAAQEPQDG